MPKKGDVIRGYKVVRKIGRGSFGDVFLMETVSLPCEQYALKIMENIPLNDEIKVGLILSQKCQFLVKFKETFVEDDELFIVMEYCGGGDLEKRVKQGPPFTDLDIYRFLFESGTAIKTLHKSKIIHRDIKTTNFFLDLFGCFKLGDFGMAKTLDLTSTKTMTLTGSQGFMSPEVMRGEKTYTEKVDVFSWGATLMQIILGYSPFATSHGAINLELAMKGTPVDAALKHPHPVMALARRMIAADPSLRPSPDDVLCFQFAALAVLHGVVEERDAALRENAKLKERLEVSEFAQDADRSAGTGARAEADAASAASSKDSAKAMPVIAPKASLKASPKASSLAGDLTSSVSLRPNPLEGCRITRTSAGEQVIFPDFKRTVFMDKEIGPATGIFRWTVQIERAKKYANFWMGIAEPAAIDNCYGNILGNQPGTCDYWFDEKTIGLYGVKQYDNYTYSVPDKSLVSIEADTVNRTLSLWVAEKKIRDMISGVNVSFYLGISSHTDGNSFTSISFQHLSSATPSTTVCVPHLYTNALEAK